MLKIDDDTGNCYAACISTITGIPFDLLALSSDEDEVLTDSERYNRINAILLSQGWMRCRLRKNIPQGYAIAGGPSPRGDFDHAVVVLNGEFFHDPHPSRSFLESIEDYEILVPLVIQNRNKANHENK